MLSQLLDVPLISTDETKSGGGEKKEENGSKKAPKNKHKSIFGSG